MNLKLGSLYTSAGGAIRMVVSLVTGPLVIRLLGVNEYGVLAVCWGVMGLCNIAQFGLVSALNIYLAAEYARKDYANARRTIATAVGLLTVSGGVVMVALLVASPSLAGRLFGVGGDAGKALLALQLLVGSLVLRFWNLALVAIEGAMLRYDWQVMIESPATLINQIGLCVVAYWTRSAWAVALWVTVTTFMVCCAHLWVLRRLLRPMAGPWTFDLQTARRLLRFGIKQWFNSLGSILFSSADRLIINAALGRDAVGIYAAAVTVANKVPEVAGMVINVLPPAVSAAYAIGDHGRIRQLLRKSARVNGAVCFAGAAGLLLLSPWVAMLVFGPTHAGTALPVLQIAGLIYGWMGLVNLAGCFALGMDRPGVIAVWSLTGSAVTLLGMKVLAGVAGLEGATWANLGFLLNALVTVAVARQLEVSLAEVGRIFAPAAAGMLLCWLLAGRGFYFDMSWWQHGALWVVLTGVLGYWIVGRELIAETAGLIRGLLEQMLASLRTAAASLSFSGEAGKHR